MNIHDIHFNVTSYSLAAMLFTIRLWDTYYFYINCKAMVAWYI